MQIAPSVIQRSLSFLFKLLLTAAAFYFVFRQVNLHELTDAARMQKIEWIALAFICIFLQIGCGGLRWHQLLAALSDESRPLLTSIRLYYASLMFNVFMPGTFGSDVARIWMAKTQNLPTGTMAYSVVMDRIFSLLGLAALMAACLPAFFPLIGLERNAGIMLAIGCALVAFVGLYSFTNLLARVDRLRRLQPIFLLMDKPRKLFASLCFAITAHLFSCVTYYALAMSLSLPAQLTDFVVLVPAVMLFSALPISIGGWGLRELGATSAFALIHIAPAHAVLIGLQVGLLTTLISACGGIIYLLEKRNHNG